MSNTPVGGQYLGEVLDAQQVPFAAAPEHTPPLIGHVIVLIQGCQDVVRGHGAVATHTG